MGEKEEFYAALAAQSKSERDALIEAAKSQGYRFGKKTQTLLQSQERLSMLDHLVNVEQWTSNANRTAYGEHPGACVG